jgi:hypothetical protein
MENEEARRIREIEAAWENDWRVIPGDISLTIAVLNIKELLRIIRKRESRENESHAN